MIKSSALKSNGKSSYYSSQISTNRSSAFLTSIPSDDIAFIESEISKIDKDLFIREQHKKKIWNQAPKVNLYADQGKSNYHILAEVRKKIIGSKGIHSVDWGQPQSYVPKESIESIFDSIQIKNFIDDKRICKERYIDLHTFKTQSKEVCLKNMLVHLMREEKNKIEKDEVLITNALGSSMKKLNEDLETFKKFTDEQRKIHKNNELLLMHLIKENKRLTEKKKILAQEHRQLLDETEKTIRSIHNMKFFAKFVHSVLGGSNEIVNFNLPEKLEIKNREKDLEEYRTIIFREIGFLETDQRIEAEVLNDPSKIMSVYRQIEDNILKLINTKADSEEKKKRYMNETDNALKDLNLKVDLQQRNYEYLVVDRNKLMIEVNEIKAKTHVNDFSVQACDLIRELGDVLKINSSLLIEEKSFPKYLESTINVIRSQDKAINEYIPLLSSFESDSSFDDLVEKARKDNRIKKQYEEIRHQLEKNKEKEIKLNLKMEKIVFKGRGRKTISIPPLRDSNNNNRKIDIRSSIESMNHYEIIEYH